MTQFACSRCGGEFFVSAKSSYNCPNCNISLEPVPQYDSEGNYTTPPEPTEYTVQGSLGQVEEDYRDTISRAMTIWRSRQEKYGPTNIASTGALGCFVRATDKLARLREVYLKGRGRESKDETIADTWLDLANYAIMGLMCEEGLWPGQDPNESPRK